MQVQFLEEAAKFLAEANDFLASDPLANTVIASVATKIAESEPAPQGPCWFAIIRDSAEVVGVAMRTHPQPPHAGFAPPMPPEAVAALVEARDARGVRDEGQVVVSH